MDAKADRVFSVIAVFGATGFMGTHLVNSLRLLYPSSRLIGISRKMREGSGCENISMDLQDAETLDGFMETYKPDLCFHLAGSINCRDWNTLFDQNVKTTTNLLESVKRHSPSCRIIIPGSASEYGEVSPERLPVTEDHCPDPLFPYGLSKLWQTTAARYYASQGMDVVIGRVFNVIGKGMANYLSIGSFLEQIRQIKAMEKPPVVEVGNISVKRDFLDVEDVCRGLIHLGVSGKTGQIYNLCSGGSVVIGDVLARIIKCSRVEVKLVSDPSKARYKSVPDIFGSFGKAKHDTGWEPVVSIQRSVERICRDL